MVVDYRGIEKLHADRAAKCQAAKGANRQDGDTCQNDFRMDVAGATEFAVWNFIKRDGIRITHYMFYFVELVSGRLLQMTNPDRSRTYAAIHQHAGRLYVHEATVPEGMPEPLLFMQSLAWADEKGLAIRYRTIYTEGYGEWKFPHPPPPFTTRDLTTSIDGTVVRPPRLVGTWLVRLMRDTTILVRLKSDTTLMTRSRRCASKLSALRAWSP